MAKQTLPDLKIKIKISKLGDALIKTGALNSVTRENHLIPSRQNQSVVLTELLNYSVASFLLVHDSIEKHFFHCQAVTALENVLLFIHHETSSIK